MNYLRMKLKALLDKCNYRQLEYIASTGTQYIDTGVIPKKTTKMIMEFMGESAGIDLSSTHSSIAGSYDSNNNSFSFNFGASVNKPHDNALFIWIDKTYDSGAAIYKFTNATLDVKHKITVQSGSATIDSTTQKVATKTADHIGTPIALFANNRNSDVWCNTRMPLRIYSCKIYEGGTLVRDYIPVEKNGQVGMYDKVTCSLFTNKGTGKFVMGDLI